MPSKPAIRRVMPATCVAGLTEGDEALKKVTLTVRRPRTGCCCWLPFTSHKIGTFKFAKSSEGQHSSSTLLDLEYLFESSRKTEAELMEVRISVNRRQGKKRQVTRVSLDQFLGRLELGKGCDDCRLVIDRSGVTLTNGKSSTCAPAPEWPFEGQVSDQLLKDHDKQTHKHQPVTANKEDVDFQELDNDINEIYKILEELPMHIKDKERLSMKDNSVVLQDYEEISLRELDGMKDELNDIVEKLKVFRKDEKKQPVKETSAMDDNEAISPRELLSSNEEHTLQDKCFSTKDINEMNTATYRDELEAEFVEMSLDSNNDSSDYSEWKANDNHALSGDQLMDGQETEKDSTNKSIESHKEAVHDGTKKGKKTHRKKSSGSSLRAAGRLLVWALLVTGVILVVTAMVDELRQSRDQQDL